MRSHKVSQRWKGSITSFGCDGLGRKKELPALTKWYVRTSGSPSGRTSSFTTDSDGFAAARAETRPKWKRGSPFAL